MKINMNEKKQKNIQALKKRKEEPYIVPFNRFRLSAWASAGGSFGGRGGVTRFSRTEAASTQSMWPPGDKPSLFKQKARTCF